MLSDKPVWQSLCFHCLLPLVLFPNTLRPLLSFPSKASNSSVQLLTFHWSRCRLVYSDRL